MRRILVAVGRITRKFNALLASLWDCCLQGIEKTIRFRGFTYSIVSVLDRFEIHITNEHNGTFLGKVADGVLYQCT